MSHQQPQPTKQPQTQPQTQLPGQPQKEEQKTVVTVFGATGKQGGSVINALLKDNKFHVRGVSKNADDEKYKKLQQEGVTMYQANFATGEGLDEALKGADAAFLVTPSFDAEIYGKEYDYGHVVVDKAHAQGVKHLVFSTAPNTEKISKGKYHHVPQFTEKARLEEYIRNMKGKDAFSSATFVAPGFYFQNFQWKVFAPKKEGDSYVFEFPAIKQLSACDINDIGQIVYEALLHPSQYNNTTLIIDSQTAPPSDYIKKFEEITKKKAHLKEIAIDDLQKNTDLHHKQEVVEMFHFLNEYGFYCNPSDSQSDPEHTIHAKTIFPALKNWEAFLKESDFMKEGLP